MHPAPMEDLVVALGELYIASAKAKETAEDMQGLIALYARNLRDYPGDIALDIVAKWRGKFFPALNELRDKIEDDTRLMKRRIHIKALRAFLDKQDKPKFERITPEQADAVIAKHAALRPRTMEE